MIQNQAQQTSQPEETAAAKQYQTALDANRTQAVQPLATVGAVSDAYKKAGSDAALGITQYGNDRGNLTAAIDAPTQERVDNRRNIADYQTDVGNLNRQQSGQDFLDSLKLNSIQPNPYMTLLTGAGNAYARAKAASLWRGRGIAPLGGGSATDPWSICGSGSTLGDDGFTGVGQGVNSPGIW